MHWNAEKTTLVAGSGPSEGPVLRGRKHCSGARSGATRESWRRLVALPVAFVFSIAAQSAWGASGTVTLTAAPANTPTIGKVVVPATTVFQVTNAGFSVFSGNGKQLAGQATPVAPSFTLTCNGTGSPCNNQTITVTITANTVSGSAFLSSLHFYMGTLSGCTTTGTPVNDATVINFQVKCNTNGGTAAFTVGMNVTVPASSVYLGSQSFAYTVSTSP